MTLASIADIAEVIGALGVIAGLVFVGIQLRQHTRQMQRGEANSAMSQGSSLRQMLLSNREVAELLVTGLRGAPLDPVDEVRLNALFTEVVYMTLHVWDRVRNHLAPKDELERLVPVVAPVISSERGSSWWARSRAAFRADFVADLELALPAIKQASATGPGRSASAEEPAETAVAPPADAG